jgi:hypothetical protein
MADLSFIEDSVAFPEKEEDEEEEEEGVEWGYEEGNRPAAGLGSRHGATPLSHPGLPFPCPGTGGAPRRRARRPCS